MPCHVLVSKRSQDAGSTTTTHRATAIATQTGNFPIFLSVVPEFDADGNYSNRNWVNRWLYHGLHSLNFLFLYNHRPLWDIVVITFMVGGTALSMTSLILAWRAIGKKMRQIVAVRERVPRPKSSPASANP